MSSGRSESKTIDKVLIVYWVDPVACPLTLPQFKRMVDKPTLGDLRLSPSPLK